MTLRAAFVSTVTSLMADDDKIALLLGDISVHAFRDAFRIYPSRCFNIGICEQASVGFAAGLAMSGFYPIYHTIDAFMVRRAYEQIYLDFGVQGLNGLFVSVGGASDYAALGPTHMCAEGADLMGFVPGMRVRSAFPRESAVEDAVFDSCMGRDLAYIRLEEGNSAWRQQTGPRFSPLSNQRRDPRRDGLILRHSPGPGS